MPLKLQKLSHVFNRWAKIKSDFIRPDKVLKIAVRSDMTCRHSYRKETNLSDIHDFDSSQLSCPLVTALCSTQINRSYFVATMELIFN